jgi:hypothetical protein
VGAMVEPTDDAKSRHLTRWLALLALAAIAAAFGRQIAIGSADKRFEERLRALDDNRD